MITRVWSDLEHFRETTFREGMNVVLAESAEDSAETESTNGLGKTTLIRIIQFCLGSDLSKDRVLNHNDLKGVLFGIDFPWGDETVEVERSTSGGGELVTVDASFLAGIEVETVAATESTVSLSADEWRRVLTRKFLARRFAEPDNISGSPSFRDISHYYMRIGKSAFDDPKTVFKNQSGPSQRLNTSYLLGLNWETQKKLHTTREKSAEIGKAIKVLKAAESTDTDSLGDLEADRVVLEEEIETRKQEVESFNVRDDYSEIEERLISVDQQLHGFINENHADGRLLENYRSSAKEVHESDDEKPLKILRDAGAVFNQDSLRSIEQVTQFHAQVYQNRQAFLKTEIDKLRADIKDRQRYIRELSDQKTELLKILSNSGALDSLIQLQRSLTDKVAELEALKSRIDERKKFDRRKDELATEISAIRTVLKNDLEDRRNSVDEAVALFARYTQHLYGRSAKLGIEIKPAGYSINITIDRDASEGVDQMVIFCFDLMIATLRARRNSPFKTLIHDSTIFADVDPRQYGLALQLANQEAETEGFQYICCLNEGALPSNHLGDLPLSDLVVQRLSDENARTRLLGIRLAAREKS